MARLQVIASSLVCVALALTSAPASASLAAPAEDNANTQAARAAYQEGEQAYRLGKFGDAAAEFEKAYELSDLPDILYNIGLAHLRWYDIDPDIAHLRKAKVVFQNYVIEIQKDPELGDLDEAQELIDQIDVKIAEADADAAVEPPPPEPTGPVDYGPDPGKKLRLAGAVTMGVGGALIVGGVVSAVVLGLRSQADEEKLSNAYRIRDEDLGCTPTDARPACDDINAEIEIHRSNGRTANALSVGLGLSLGGVGVIGVVAGAVLFVQANKKTKTWEQRQLSLVPTWTPTSTGLSLSGRF